MWTNMTQFRCARQSSCKALMNVLQFILVAAILNGELTIASATMSPEMVASTDDTNTAALAGYGEKRSWQSLQGPWGKRVPNSAVPWNSESTDADDDVFMAEHWVPVLTSTGERADPFLKYTLVYLTNSGTLDRLMNQRQADEATGGVKLTEDLLSTLEEAEGADDGIMTEKRTWKNMNAAWGKRRSAPAWNKFRDYKTSLGAWGKREPGWNNLKGMWGKRASKDWQKLHGGWGKRADIMN